MVIENFSKALSNLLNKGDDLSRIELEVKIEAILNQVQDKGYLNVDLFIELSLVGVPFLDYLKRYKDISGEEAKGLVSYGYITFDVMIKILESGIELHK